MVPKALVRALISDATGIGGSSGGSTLTQQLVKQQILTDETTFKRKANEILLALRIEKYFSKDEIVTTYLNVPLLVVITKVKILQAWKKQPKDSLVKVPRT